MQQYVIGTAGHVDHGKTVLIGALTGEQTDRLPEEQKRGISIDLGFAEFELPSGKRAGVVDVPGHERFIKNMVAGVTGIDMVVLVVAADEGVMPQTREHLDILQLLGVQKGIVAITKTDLVDEEWLELVQEDVAEALEDTFLEGSPMLPVSAREGVGLESLIEVVDSTLDTVRPRNPSGFARLPIDRVFTVSGFGTVVTGTLVSGTMRVEDRLDILPLRQETRVRGLQVHGQDVFEALAGQRVAVNLSGVDVDELSRGEVLLTPGSFRPTMTFAADIEMLAHVDWSISNNDRVRLHTGTSEILGRVLLLDRSELFPGERAYIQFKAERPVVVARGDRYIIRTYSPMTTIAGGEILDTRRRFRRFNDDHLHELQVRQEGDLSELVILQLEGLQPAPASTAQLADRLAVPVAEIEPVLMRLDNNHQILQIGSGLWLTPEGEEELRQRVVTKLLEYHENYPLRMGRPREELRQAVLPSVEARDFQQVLEYLSEQKVLTLKREFVADVDFGPSLSPHLAETGNQLVDTLARDPFAPPNAREVLEDLGIEAPEAVELLGYLREQGDVVRVSEELYFAAGAIHRGIEELKEWFKSHDTITVSELRDLLQTSRKYAVPLLEYFDQKRITQRVGDKRILRVTS